MRLYQYLIMTFLVLYSYRAVAMEEKESGRRVVRILTVDGGGIRGIIPATVLEGIEERLQANQGEKTLKIADYFDIMAGTSVGAIIVLALNAGKSSRDLVNFFIDKSATVFQPVEQWSVEQSYNEPKYSSDGLEKVLNEQFDDKWLSECSSHVLIPAYNVNQRCAYLFDSCDAQSLSSSDFKMKDVARASSAAPLFFKKAVIKNREDKEYVFVDGGGHANNPTFEAMSKANEVFPGCDFFIVSLGTGETPRDFGCLRLENGKNSMLITKIVDHLVNNQADEHEKSVRSLVESITQQQREIRLYRIQVTINFSHIDGDNYKNIESLRQAGLFNLNQENPSEIPSYISQIVEELKNNPPAKEE